MSRLHQNARIDQAHTGLFLVIMPDPLGEDDVTYIGGWGATKEGALREAYEWEEIPWPDE